MNIGSLLQGLAGLAWLGALAALGFVVFNIARGRKLGSGAPIIAGAVVLALLLTTAASGLVFIDPDQRGVVISALANAERKCARTQVGASRTQPTARRSQRLRPAGDPSSRRSAFSLTEPTLTQISGRLLGPRSRRYVRAPYPRTARSAANASESSATVV